MSTTSLSTGHALEKKDLENIPVANLSPKSVWLEKGVTLGTLEEIQEVVKAEESGEVSGTNATIEEMDEKTKKLLDNLKSRIGENLHEDKKSEVLKILKSSISCFAFSEDDLGHCTLVKHDINTGVNHTTLTLDHTTLTIRRTGAGCASESIVDRRWRHKRLRRSPIDRIIDS